MEFYYSKKKILLSLWISVLVLMILVPVSLYIIDYANNTRNPEALIVIPLLFFFPGAVVAAIYLLKYIYLLLIPEKLLLRIDEQGILLNMNKTCRKAGFITWKEIANIIHSTDNMNKPAIRISLAGHVNGMYQFYITKQDTKKMGLRMNELFDMIMTYYNANK